MILSLNLYDFYIELQRGRRRDAPRRKTARAIPVVRRAHQCCRFTHLHAEAAFIPSLDHSALSDLKLEGGLAWIPRGPELLQAAVSVHNLTCAVNCNIVTSLRRKIVYIWGNIDRNDRTNENECMDPAVGRDPTLTSAPEPSTVIVFSTPILANLYLLECPQPLQNGRRRHVNTTLQTKIQIIIACGAWPQAGRLA